MAGLALPGALRRPVMRIDPDPGIGEFGHVGAADHDKAGTAQPRHHGGVGFRRGGILQRARACAGHLPPDVEQILDRDRNAGVGRRCCLHLAQPVHRLGSLDCGFGIDVNEGPLALARRVADFGEARIDQLAGAGAAALEIGGEFGKFRRVRHGFLVPWLSDRLLVIRSRLDVHIQQRRA